MNPHFQIRSDATVSRLKLLCSCWKIHLKKIKLICEKVKKAGERRLRKGEESAYIVL